MANNYIKTFLDPYDKQKLEKTSTMAGMFSAMMEFKNKNSSSEENIFLIACLL